jgi:hypothetical protein
LRAVVRCDEGGAGVVVREKESVRGGGGERSKCNRQGKEQKKKENDNTDDDDKGRATRLRKGTDGSVDDAEDGEAQWYRWVEVMKEKGREEEARKRKNDNLIPPRPRS